MSKTMQQEHKSDQFSQDCPRLLVYAYLLPIYYLFANTVIFNGN